MKKYKYILILILTVLISAFIFFFWSNENGKNLWEICNPQLANCKDGLVCQQLGVSDMYRCIKYLKEGDECGISVAEICSEGLTCTDTNNTRQRCGTFSTDGGKECFTEPVQVCK